MELGQVKSGNWDDLSGDSFSIDLNSVLVNDVDNDGNLSGIRSSVDIDGSSDLDELLEGLEMRG